MNSHSRAAIALLALLVSSASAAAAQRATSSCAYDTCALRIRAATFTRPPALVRGMDDVEVATLTPFGSAVAPHFERVDSAFVQAQRYDRLIPTAAVIGMAGTGLMVLAPVLFDLRDQPVASIVFFAGGFGLTLYGTHLTNTATDALSRAIWWHNR